MNPQSLLKALDQLTTPTTDAKIHAQHQSIADEMNALSVDEPTLADTHLSLSAYLEAVKLVITDIFDHEVWIQAELRSVNVKGGHYYFELAEKDDDDNIIASARATLWRYRANAVVNKFVSGTGKPLTAGLAVLLKGSASFHPQYGFSINISDIDPTYTLGALALAYNAMLKRLQDQGLTTLNKALPTPFDIRHVLVIAPERAAGLGDFRAEADRLSDAGACQFYYHHATFQGNHAPKEIREAIRCAIDDFHARHAHHADLLVIIRGGGAVGDLAYLNDYELCALIAESPMPVWVGVGHERDRVLLDEVAHTRFDTPSKVIHAIENHLIQMITLIKNTMNTITEVSRARLSLSGEQSRLAMRQIHHGANQTLVLAKKDSGFLLSHLKSHAKHHVYTQKNHLDDLLSDQQKNTARMMKSAHQNINLALHQHKALLPRLSALRDETRHLQSMVLLQHPARTLAKGYALIRQNNTVIHSAQNAQQGEIEIEFHDGRIQAIVTDRAADDTPF